MFGTDKAKLEKFASVLQDQIIQEAFEKLIREKYAANYVSVDCALEKRNGEYIDGEMTEWFEFFKAGYLTAMGEGDPS